MIDTHSFTRFLQQLLISLNYSLNTHSPNHRLILKIQTIKPLPGTPTLTIVRVYSVYTHLHPLQQPPTPLSQANRWALNCSICREKNKGACIQCAVRTCNVAFHVTCSIRQHLLMQTVVDYRTDDVRFKVV